MAKVVILHEYNRPEFPGIDPYDRDKDGNILNPSRTRQEMAEDCDINAIMKKYKATGQVPTNMKDKPIFGDFTVAGSYNDALEFINYAQEEFMKLPAQLRARFQNDPGNLLEFVSNPANAQELVTLGLATKREQPKAPDTVPAPQNTPPAGTPKEGVKP